ncbi:MAG: hypothetical protein HY231_24920 [Acidobacteria bacterium]|nr:hypothetical protein [Acidobacteriota bacterium]
MKQINSRAGEGGAVTIKTLLTLVIVVVAIFSAIKVLPTYAEQRQIIFDIDELANKSAARNLKEDDIKKAMESLRVKYSLPENSITLIAYGQSNMQISLAYNRLIDFFVTTYDWKVNYIAHGKAI